MKGLQISFTVEGFNLDNTLNSSYASYLFKKMETREGTCWVGIAKPILNVKMVQLGKELKFQFESDDIFDYLYLHVTGLWIDFEPSFLRGLDAKCLETVERLIQLFPGVRVPWLYLNKWHILISTIFSIHARVEMSKAWFASLVNLNPELLRTMNPLELRSLTEKSTGVSAGFRARYLVETVNELFNRTPTEDPLEQICRLPIAEARIQLCKIRNLGPKVCDCFLLNGLGDLTSAPIDIHVGRVSEYLGVVPPGLGQPSAGLCRRFVCVPSQANSRIQLCPRAERTLEYLEDLQDPSATCLRAALTNKFEYAGWIQALLFLFGQTYCVWTPRGIPHCECCPLRDRCSRKEPGGLSDQGARERRSRVAKARVKTVGESQFLKVFELFPELEKTVIDKANAILRDVEKLEGLRSRVQKATSIWIACRSLAVPALLKEVAQSYSIRPRDILNATAMLLEKSDIKIGLLRPEVYIERVRRALLLSEGLRDLAVSISKRSGSLNPVSQAAAAVYLASTRTGLAVSQRTISKALGLSEVTVRNAISRFSYQSNPPF